MFPRDYTLNPMGLGKWVWNPEKSYSTSIGARCRDELAKVKALGLIKVSVEWF